MADYYDHMVFNSPLCDARVDGLVATLAARRPRTVLDVGCGWAELLLRIVAATPDARGLGVDLDEQLVERGRANAHARGLSDRVAIEVRDGSELDGPVDLIVCTGADHIWGGQPDALAALHGLLRPGGVLLFGSGFWDRPPTDEQAAACGATPSELSDLAGLVDLAIEHGFRPLQIQTANRDEWNAFESGFLADWEEWLVRNPSAPDAAEHRARADAHRNGWLRGYRDVLGFAYLVLATVGA